MKQQVLLLLHLIDQVFVKVFLLALARESKITDCWHLSLLTLATDNPSMFKLFHTKPSSLCTTSSLLSTFHINGDDAITSNNFYKLETTHDG